MKLLLSIFSMMFFTWGSLWGQDSAQPKVFILGEDEALYERLTQTYNQPLLEACHNDVQVAFEQWLNMMQEIDDYAERIRFDIKGVKVWMHVFWNSQGAIDHIGYLLRPDSRNISTAELSAFLSSFMNRYTFPQTSDRKFSHYTGATFPTFTQNADKNR
jgi:hypothetical protein